jgi:phosphoribosylaminoimidazole-succinocarboxamide synthase
MNAPETLYQSDLASLPLRGRGKVRDIYDIDENHLLIVATDRISAFDCILPDPVPGKGRVLTSVSNFWFRKLGHVLPNHLAELTLEDVLKDAAERHQVTGRATVARKLKPLPVEAVVRGYLIGSGWKDYLATGSVCGIALPPGLKQAEQLPRPIFTPSTKAEMGAHDENISFERTAELIGTELAEQLRDAALRLYTEAAAYALERGIIIADTKFEFGLDRDGTLVLIDEVLTPDSSRFWPRDQYRTGISPPSYDKQFVRDYLETLAWEKRPPAPKLPPEVIAKTAAKYREAEERLTAP